VLQRFGVDISIAQAALRDNCNPPATFQLDPGFIFVRVYPKNAANKRLREADSI